MRWQVTLLLIGYNTLPNTHLIHINKIRLLAEIASHHSDDRWKDGLEIASETTNNNLPDDIWEERRNNSYHIHLGQSDEVLTASYRLASSLVKK
jgi:hypothetical protein